MDFGKDYDILVDKATFSIKQFEINADPSEVVSTVYLQLFSTPSYKYDYFAFERAIVIYCKYFNGNNVEFIPYADKWKKSSQHFDFKGQKVCIVCKETKTTSEFKIKENSIGKKSQRNQCNQCYSAWRKNYNIINKEKAQQQKINRKKTAPETIKLQKTKVNIDRHNNLPDYYIKGILLEKYSIDYINSNPNLFEDTRKRILEKRRRGKIKRIKNDKKIVLRLNN